MTTYVVEVDAREAHLLLPTRCSCAVHCIDGRHSNAVKPKGHAEWIEAAQSFLSLWSEVKSGDTIIIQTESGNYNTGDPYQIVRLGEVVVQAVQRECEMDDWEPCGAAVCPGPFRWSVEVGEQVRYYTPQTFQPCPECTRHHESVGIHLGWSCPRCSQPGGFNARRIPLSSLAIHTPWELAT